METKLNEVINEKMNEDNAKLMEDLKAFSEEVKEYSNVLNYPEDNDDTNKVVAMVSINPETGTEDIIGTVDPDNLPEEDNSFESMMDSIEDVNVDGEVELDNSPVTDKEMSEYMSDPDNTLISEMTDKPEISIEATKELLKVVNKKISGEKFNVYNELPKEIKDIIDKYVTRGFVDLKNPTSVNIMAIKKHVANTLIDDFINDIQTNRLKRDFETDLQSIYKDSIKDIASGTLDFIDKRNKAYRESADSIEDPEKKNKMLAILDQIDEARSLSTLKEYAKHCRIKSIELEKPDNRVYSSFLYKYKNSTNNIYDINIAKKVLLRHLGKDGITTRDIDAFFIAFCKQVKNFSPAKPIEHAYMYYVVYYCALLDGDNSEVFKNNVKEVINNLRERNPILKK